MGVADFLDLSRNILAKDKALYHGHAVAAVAATSERIAEQALSGITVDYCPPHCFSRSTAAVSTAAVDTAGVEATDTHTLPVHILLPPGWA